MNSVYNSFSHNSNLLLKLVEVDAEQVGFWSMFDIGHVHLLLSALKSAMQTEHKSVSFTTLIVLPQALLIICL